MTEGRIFRRATSEDIEFLTGAIIEAERSGGDKSLYERVFDMRDAEVRALVESMVRENISGSELCADSFWVAVEDEERLGCVATWVEGGDGTPSQLLRASLLSHAVGLERWREAQSKLRALTAIDIPREPNTLQIEAVYTAPPHRGRGLVAALINRALEASRSEHPEVVRAQVLSVRGNASGARAFLKSGFHAVRESCSDDPAIAAIFPGDGRILWERSIT